MCIGGFQDWFKISMFYESLDYYFILLDLFLLYSALSSFGQNVVLTKKREKKTESSHQSNDNYHFKSLS